MEILEILSNIDKEARLIKSDMLLVDEKIMNIRKAMNAIEDGYRLIMLEILRMKKE